MAVAGLLGHVSRHPDQRSSAATASPTPAVSVCISRSVMTLAGSTDAALAVQMDGILSFAFVRITLVRGSCKTSLSVFPHVQANRPASNR